MRDELYGVKADGVLIQSDNEYWGLHGHVSKEQKYFYIIKLDGTDKEVRVAKKYVRPDFYHPYMAEYPMSLQ